MKRLGAVLVCLAALVGHSSVEDGSSWWLVEGDRLVPVVDSPSVLRPVLAPAGGVAVWVESRAVGSREFVSDVGEVESTLVRYDLRRRAVTHTWTTRRQVTCCDRGGDLFILGIGTDGRVLITLLGQRDLLWAPGTDPVALRGPGGGRMFGDQWPGGVMWQGDVGMLESAGRYGTVSADGHVEPVGMMPNDQDGLWAPDGSVYAYPGDDSGESPVKSPLARFWVQDLAGDRTELVPPPLEEGDLVDLVAWESLTTVVLEVRRPYDQERDDEGGVVAFVRCDTGTGECAVTTDEPGPRARPPEPW